MVERPRRAPLRILSLACAAGEEPYSIAIVLAELGHYRLAGTASMLLTSALRRLVIADRGVYSLNAFRGVDARCRARHFREHAGGYELDPRCERRFGSFKVAFWIPSCSKVHPSMT